MISQWIDFGVLERNRAEHGDGITREEEDEDDEKKKKGQHAVGPRENDSTGLFLSLCCSPQVYAVGPPLFLFWIKFKSLLSILFHFV